MGDQPWNRAEGKFDRPTSSIPKTRAAEAVEREADRQARRMIRDDPRGFDPKARPPRYVEAAPKPDRRIRRKP